jgi:hypothetical protein
VIEVRRTSLDALLEEHDISRADARTLIRIAAFKPDTAW